MDIAEQLETIRRRIHAACESARRDPASVRLVAVSKGHPPAAITAAADAGQMLFGESRVQEARAKIGRCPGHLTWHLVGHLQTNKCRDAVQFFSMIQSVDSLHLAAEINKWADRLSKSMPVLLEVNVAGEASKNGFSPDQLTGRLEEINGLERLEIHGLMTIVPFATDPEKVRPHFAKMRELQATCQDVLGAPLPELSMGMSNDFEVAVQEGATMVRVGTGIFGDRPRPAKA